METWGAYGWRRTRRLSPPSLMGSEAVDSNFRGHPEESLAFQGMRFERYVRVIRSREPERRWTS